MIQLSPQDIAEFRRLVRQETGQDLTEEQAHDQALNLLRLVAFVVKSEANAES